jgi:hypothetical protein
VHLLIKRASLLANIKVVTKAQTRKSVADGPHQAMTDAVTDVAIGITRIIETVNTSQGATVARESKFFPLNSF